MSYAVVSVAIEHPAPRIPSFTGGWNMKEKKDDSATSRSHRARASARASESKKTLEL